VADGGQGGDEDDETEGYEAEVDEEAGFVRLRHESPAQGTGFVGGTEEGGGGVGIVRHD